MQMITTNVIRHDFAECTLKPSVPQLPVDLAGFCCFTVVSDALRLLGL